MDLEIQNGAEVSVNGQHHEFRHGEESDKCGRWRDIVLAYKTLGFVFGSLVTSPLYVYPSVNLNSPTEED